MLAHEPTMQENFAQLAGLVHQLAQAVQVQAKKIAELDQRVEYLEAQRRTDAVGKTYGGFREEC